MHACIHTYMQVGRGNVSTTAKVTNYPFQVGSIICKTVRNRHSGMRPGQKAMSEMMRIFRGLTGIRGTFIWYSQKVATPQIRQRSRKPVPIAFLNDCGRAPTAENTALADSFVSRLSILPSNLSYNRCSKPNRNCAVPMSFLKPV